VDKPPVTIWPKMSEPTLTCPSCGAPTPPDAARCEYCHAVLARVSCPQCFGLLFDGSQFCPHCGTPRSRAEVIDAKPLPCPACRSAMKWIHVGTTDLLECEGCDGTWIEATTFEQLCADRDGQSRMLERAPAGDVTRAQPDPVRYRPCPKCRKLMNRVNFGRLSGTVVDVCRGHGTFLDRGELHRIVQFIMDGGLDRARRADRDQLLEDQRRIRSENARLEQQSDSSSPWSGGTLQTLLNALFTRE
jgi:Zn-finger nucleic acid-binding protein